MQKIVQETDAERSSRLAGEMLKRDFPEKHGDGVKMQKLKEAWPETAAAHQKVNPKNITPQE